VDSTILASMLMKQAVVLQVDELRSHHFSQKWWAKNQHCCGTCSSDAKNIPPFRIWWIEIDCLYDFETAANYGWDFFGHMNKATIYCLSIWRCLCFNNSIYCIDIQDEKGFYDVVSISNPAEVHEATLFVKIFLIKLTRRFEQFWSDDGFDPFHLRNILFLPISKLWKFLHLTFLKTFIPCLWKQHDRIKRALFLFYPDQLMKVLRSWQKLWGKSSSNVSSVVSINEREK